MEALQEAKENEEETKESHLQEKALYWEIYRENQIEEEVGRLKSISLWLKAGDKNTTYFHNSMKIRRSRNQIEKIQIEGKEIKGSIEFKKEAHIHFKNLLIANGESAYFDSFLQHTPNEISDAQNT